MKFIRTFAGGTVTAFLTVEDGVSVRWRGKPSKSILSEYAEWMRDSLQTVADTTGRSVAYFALESGLEPMVVAPSASASTHKQNIPPRDA